MTRNRKIRRQQSRTGQSEPSENMGRKTFLTVLFAVYALIIIAQYLKHSIVTAGTMLSSILGYFSPLFPGQGGPDRLFGSILHDAFAVLVSLLIVVSAFGFGLLLQKLVPAVAAENELDKIFIAMGAGSLLLILALFMLGALGLLSPVPAGIVILAGAGMALTPYMDYAKLKSELQFSGTPFLMKVLMTAGALLAFIVAIGTLVPEIFYDSLVYHLAAANWYKLTHGLRPPLSETVHFFIPGYVRLLYAACLVFSDEISAKVLHYLFALVTAGALFIAGRNLFSRNAGIYAALAFLTIPSVGIVGVRSAMETFLCFFEFGSLYFALQFIRSGQSRWLGISGLLLGAAIGCKYLSLMSWAAIGIVLIVDAIAQRRPFRETVRNVIVWNGAILAASAAWFAYNTCYSGNPLYPAFWRYIGHLHPKYFEAVGALGKTISFKDILLSPWNISMGLREEAFAGVLFLLFIPLIFFIRRNAMVKYVSLYAVIYWLMWMNIEPYFYFRYFLPAMPALCLLAAYAMTELDGVFVRLVVLAVVLINTAQVAAMHRVIYSPVDYVTGNITKQEYLSSNRQTYPNPNYSALNWINENLPQSSTILLQGEERAYYLNRRYVPVTISDSNYLITVLERSKDADDAARLLRQEGITHILLNVPEAYRLKSSDLFHFELREYGIFLAFWDKYLREVHRALPDFMIPNKGILSVRRQQPQQWEQYAGNDSGYTYVYELLSPEDATRPHAAPRNFLKEPAFFIDSRWKKIEPALGGAR